MIKEKIQKIIITFVVFLFAISAVGYLVAPSKMLSIVGIVSNPQTDFLVRTLAIALLALTPTAWTARNRDNSRAERAVLVGLASYMFLSSAVDFHAYLNHIVGFASVPSVIFRIILGAIIVWLASKRLSRL